MNFHRNIKQAAAALVAFNLMAASAVAAETAAAYPAMTGTVPFYAGHYLSPEYLSAMVGAPVAVFSEADLDPGLFQELKDVKAAIARTGDAKARAALRAEEGALLDKAFENILSGLEAGHPRLAAGWTAANAGYLRFMIDSASVRTPSISGACLPGAGCVIFISDESLDAASWDAAHGIAGDNQLSVPEKFTVLEAWEELFGTTYIAKDGGYAPIPDGLFQTMARAEQEGLVTDAELDSYFQLGLVQSIVRGDGPSFELLAYYQYLKGERDAGRAGEAMKTLLGQVAETHAFIYDSLKEGWENNRIADAREELKRQLVDLVQDESQPESVRFYAGAYLQMYVKRGDLVPANARADNPFYNRTLAGALEQIAPPAPVAAPPSLNGPR